jgi:hypothetical protein
MPIDRLAPANAQGRLRDCLGAVGSVIPGGHFRDELRHEGLTLTDAWHVLRTGTVYNAPELDIRTGEWKYTIEGHAPEGIWLCIVFCFKRVDAAFLITVFSIASKRRLK